jgi:uncharacterized protein YgiM (DUF1202 family)
MKWLKLAAISVCLLSAQAYAAVEVGVALKADAIKQEPFSDAATVGNLNAGDKVNIFSKDGGWLKIKSNQGNGWVRMLSIRKGDAKKARSLADSFKGLASGRTGTGQVVATTGIRGLNEEELKTAKFDAKELNLAESYATSRAEAQTFANQGKLKARSLEYLPLPE